MNIFTLSSSLFILVLFTGCVEELTQPAPEPKTEIVLLSQKVQELDAHDKQLIYRSIQNEINIHNEKGDEAYESGYNHDAIVAYELVNFYEGYNTIPLNKIAQIKTTAKSKSIYHYKQALLYEKKNIKQAVIELNRVMINNPGYKDAQDKLHELRSNRDIKIFINSMENSLQMKLLNNRGTVKDLKGINSGLHNLLKYDYNNSTALKAKATLKEYHKVLVENAIKLFKEGKLTKSKSKFSAILSIYKKDQTSIDYLARIKIINSKKTYMKLAKDYLKNREFINSMKYAQKVLRVEPKNKEARSILTKAKKESKREVANLLHIGKRHYNNKNLDKAQESFNAVLEIDPYNNTSLIYSKKIERQLKTIKSLQ
ncbi:MAG: hypothetical protein ABFQ64_08020 [Campylobacterota bacterium]